MWQIGLLNHPLRTRSWPVVLGLRHSPILRSACRRTERSAIDDRSMRPGLWGASRKGAWAVLPLGPRFSPDGEQVFCFGNGRIYRHRLTDDTTETVVDIDGSHASFPAVSPDAGALAFSALGLPMDPENRPPRLFLLDLPSGKTEQVAPDHRHSADRFPQWSPTTQIPHLSKRKTSLEPAVKRAKMDCRPDKAITNEVHPL